MLTRKPRTLGTRYRKIVQWSDQDNLYQDQTPTLHPGLVSDASDIPLYMELFHHARTCTLEDLETALSPTDFWYSYALPLGHTADAVKHAICALGGAHRAFKLQRVKEHPAAHELQHISIQQYNQAIRHVKLLMEMAVEKDMEIILTCCVIFISIENLLGRYAESVRHMKAGTSLLISLMRQRGRTQDTRLPSGAVFDDLSTSSAKFLDDIAEALCRLGNDVWGYTREMIAPDLNFFDTTNKALASASKFTCVGEAERAFHDVAKLIEADRTVASQSMIPLAPMENGHHTTRHEPSFMPQDVPHEHQLIRFEELKAIFNKWSERFDQFRERLQDNNATKQDVLRTRALAVDQALWSGWLNCKVWGAYRQEDYEEILQRAESLVELGAFQSGPVFAFDGSLILSLAIPCVSSMDCDIQWRTIRLLRSFWRKEGIWDSQELADILEAMMFAKSIGMVTKEMLPWDVPHLAGLMESLQLSEVKIPEGPLSLV